MSQIRMQALLRPRASSASGAALIGWASAPAIAAAGFGSPGRPPLRMTVGGTPSGGGTGRRPLANSRSTRESGIVQAPWATALYALDGRSGAIWGPDGRNIVPDRLTPSV